MNLRQRNSYIILVAGSLALLFTVWNIGNTARLRQHLDEAVKSGKLEQVREILNNNPRLVAMRDGHSKATALHVAAEAGRTDIVELLIAEGAEIDAETRTGWTPLHRAVDTNNPDVAELLVAHGANVNAPGRGNSPLQRAAFAGNVEMIELLLEAQADINARGTGGWTALFFACCGGNVEAVELLISEGAEVCDTDEAGRTPFEVAMIKGHEDVASVMRRYGAVP